MTEIRIPKLNNNDDTYILLEWLVADDQPVGPGHAVVTIETSKTAEDLVCEAPGILRHLVPAGSACTPGDLIGTVVPVGHPAGTASPTAPAPAASPAAGTASAADGDGPVITEPARALIEEQGVDLQAVRNLGIPVVKRADVERLIAAVGQADVHRLSPGQQAVARNVELASQTIPAAYTAVRVAVAAALRESSRLTQRLRRPVGLPELLVAAVARLHGDFPLFFATPLDGRSVRLAAEPHIGVTIDIGRGLYVPVVRNAARLAFGELAGVLTGFRNTALGGAFSEQDLAGGNITVTLHNDPAVSVAVPMIFPGQTCALALTGAHPELAGGDAGLDPVMMCGVGLAYDHRVINGRDAVLFLRAVKDAIESPGTLTGQ